MAQPRCTVGCRDHLGNRVPDRAAARWDCTEGVDDQRAGSCEPHDTDEGSS